MWGKGVCVLLGRGKVKEMMVKVIVFLLFWREVICLLGVCDFIFGVYWDFRNFSYFIFE